jgi:pullulanase
MHLIEKELKKRHPSIMLYGEGWNMMTEVPAKQRPHMGNHAYFPAYAHFNDFFRNTMKGELHGPGLGFTMGNSSLMLRAMDAMIGSPNMFLTPNQSINYVECHDNMTYYDKLILSCGYEKESFKYFQDFANHLIAISQGIPFYHAGQEFYRSKKGVENSYNSPDEINKIHWNTKADSVKKLKAILKIRKRYSLYRKTKDLSHVAIYKDQNMIKYVLEDKKVMITHYLKHDDKIEKLPLEGGKILFYSQNILMEENHIFVDKPGVYIVLIHKL